MQKWIACYRILIFAPHMRIAFRNFRWSSRKYNYDSQAYIYRNLFDYDFIFIVIDKNTHKLNIFEVSNEAYERGQEKVEKAAEAYKLYYQSKDFDPKQYLEVNTI